MDASEAERLRGALVRDGYCVVDHVLSPGFLGELRAATDQIIESTPHPPQWKYQGSDIFVQGVRHQMREGLPRHEILDRLIEWAPTRAALEAMGLGDFRSDGAFIILSTPAGGAPLYWHQDWMKWNDPYSLSPWPQTIFLSYYLVDTTRDNGCMRVIPGTHHRRVELHDHLVPPHAQGGYWVKEEDPWMFSEQPGELDLPVKAGQLVIGDARVLHAAHGNKGATRRTLMLGWHSRPLGVPSWWTGAIPEEIRARPADAQYQHTRVPGAFLR